MTTFGLTLVIAAAFCHATWNFFVKRINGGAELIWLFSVLSVVIYFPFAAWILIAQTFTLGPLQLAFIAGSATLHLGYFMLLQLGYRKGDLSLVYPTARATGPLLSTAFAVAVVGEAVNAQLVIGAGVVIIGVLCLTGGFRNSAENFSVSLLFGLAVGVIIGSYTTWDAYAVSTLLIPPLLLDYASSIGRVLVLAPVANARRQLMAKHWNEHRWGVIAIAVFSPLAYILVLYALTFTPIVYVAPAREVSVVLTVLAGSILLDESDLRRRLTWSVVILGGVALLVTA